MAESALTGYEIGCCLLINIFLFPFFLDVGFLNLLKELKAIIGIDLWMSENKS